MPPIVIRYDRRRVLRGAAIAWVLGMAFTGLVAWSTAARGPAAGPGGLPRWIVPLLLLGTPLSAGCAWAAAHALRRRNRVTLTEDGILLRDSLGEYRLGWDNLAGCETRHGALAVLRPRDWEPVVASHTGTPEQRTLLANRPPGEDSVVMLGYQELDCGLERFIELVERFRARPDERSTLAD